MAFLKGYFYCSILLALIATLPSNVHCFDNGGSNRQRVAYNNNQNSYSGSNWAQPNDYYNNLNENGYNYRNNDKTQYTSPAYSGQFYNGARDFSVCDDSVVRVTALYVVCDSPYTFYYGNGARRNSRVCGYGDKLSMEVRFEVVDDIRDDPIFVTIGVYDQQNSLLASISPLYLCDDLVGYDCTSQGYYGFQYRMRLSYPASSTSDESSSGTFLPNVNMAFSSKSDSGYNLGALNVHCQDWRDSYVAWSRNEPPRSPMQRFFINYGLLLVSGVVLLALGSLIWHQATRSNQIVDVVEEPNGKSVGLID